MPDSHPDRELGTSTDKPPPVISKRVNARLQLAAALIEADNEAIYEKADYWHLSHPDQGSDAPRPPPPPQPALASQSAIFTPYRDGVEPTLTRHVRTWSGATGLSQILTPKPDGERPSIDFLGLSLPNGSGSLNGARTSMSGARPSMSLSRPSMSGSRPSMTGSRHSRADSFLSHATSGRPSFSSASASHLAQIGDDSTLTDWGVDKFLSTEERERSALSKRDRAFSIEGPRSTDIGNRKDQIAAVATQPEKATSEIITLSKRESTKMDLLAKIKLYRERQENLPPSQWDGPGPQATKDEVLDHLRLNNTDSKPTEAKADDNAATPIASRFSFEKQPMTEEQDAPVESYFGSQLARTMNKGAFDLATPEQLSQAFASTPQSNTADADMVGIGSYSRSQSRRNSLMGSPLFSGTALAAEKPELGRSVSDNRFGEVEMGLGPSPFAAAVRAASFSAVEKPTIDTANLTTKQLQTIARNSTFPSHLGINRDLLDDFDYNDYEEEDEFGQLLPMPKRASMDVAALAEDLAKTGGANFKIRMGDDAPPDLSSANWGKPRRKWFRLSTMADAKGKTRKTKDSDIEPESDAEVLDSAQNAQDEVDDDFISPPRKGPLRPLGLTIRLPQTLVMPSQLQGTALAPKLRLVDGDADVATSGSKRHSLHVPDGFVLHDARSGLPPMRSLVVQSASGPQATFVAKTGSKKHQETIAKAIAVGRTVHVPLAAPRGIGRRAAVPTTALFRNQLVQHEDEREGWGWEAGTRASDTLAPDAESSDDDRPLADIKKNGRLTKRAAKKLAKEKRKRKAARRVRRANRAEAVQNGQEISLDDLSSDQDADLSSTTSESAASEDGSDSDLWASDDDKRWVDDTKPAGKLYGKSLLDIATERTKERKSKARFYGQVQLEDEEPTMIQLDDTVNDNAHDDGASVAPSVAKYFRETPLGYDNTRERMESVFGADQLWAREMAKRREDEAHEAALAEAALTEELAKPQPKKGKGLFARNKKNTPVDNELAAKSSVSVHEDAEPAEIEEVPERSVTPIQPLTLALDHIDTADEVVQGRRQAFALLTGEDKAMDEWIIKSAEVSAGEDSDDDVPLSQIRKSVATRPSFAAGLKIAEDDSSSGEELPLAALKEKRARQSMMLGTGKLDLNFNVTSPGLASPVHLPTQSADTSDSEDDLPLGQRHPGGTAALAAIKVAMEQKKVAERESRRLTRMAAGSQNSDDSEDDKPLGYSHPQAAIIAEQAALIRQLQADQKSPTGSAYMPHRQSMMMDHQSSMYNDPRMSMMMSYPSSMMGMPQYDGMPAMSAGLPLHMSMAGGSQIGFGGPASVLAPGSPSMSMLVDPKASSIHNWRTQVPPDAALTPSGGTSVIDSARN